MGSLDDEKLAQRDKRRAKQATVPNTQKPSRKPLAHAVAAHEPSTPVERVAEHVRAHTDANRYYRFIELLAMISDNAWLRVIPKHDEGITHWYVKWNSGRWAGSYVYYGQHEGDTVSDAVDFLTNRYSEVERGDRKPIRDTAYSGK